MTVLSFIYRIPNLKYNTVIRTLSLIYENIALRLPVSINTQLLVSSTKCSRESTVR